MLYPAPVAIAWESVMLVLPLLVSVIVCALLVPTLTFPKLMLAGVALSRFETPFPVSATEDDESGVALTIVTVPVVLPVTAGENQTVKLTICPACTEVGKEGPLMVNPDPVRLA